MRLCNFPPISSLVPHQGGMILLREIILFDDDAIECLCDLCSSNLFDYEAGRVSSMASLEIMAQAIAAHAGLVARKNGEEIKVGLLLGTRRLDIFTEYFIKGEELLVAARRTWQDGEMAICEGSIQRRLSNELLAHGKLNVFVPDDFARWSTRSNIDL